MARHLQPLEDASATDPQASNIADAINAAYVAAARALEAKGYTADPADTAEALIGAITWFFFASNRKYLGGSLTAGGLS